MARHRDFFYCEDDVQQSIDGFGTEHCVLNILDLANSDPDNDLSTNEYFHFINVQCGKSSSGLAKPTVELWEYFYWGAAFFTLTEAGTTNTFYSFPVMWSDSSGGLPSTETFPLQFVILAGGVS